MADYLIQSETLDDIADAINAKTGGSSAMTPAEMVTAIGSISVEGGSDTLESDFLVIRKETVVAGENTVSNASQHYSYLNGLKSVSGTLFAVSMHPKASYEYNEIGNGLSLQSNIIGYRYRSGWSNIGYASQAFDAILVPGSIYDLYTAEIINPRTV